MSNKNLDLSVVFLATILAIAFISIPVLQENIVRAALGLLLSLFLPGYALVASLFPRKKDLKEIERIALSLGLSIAVTPLIGLILNYTPMGITSEAVLTAVSAFTLLCLVAAFIRRNNLPAKEAYSLEFEKISLGKGTDRLLSIILLITILLSVAVLIYVIVTPKQGEKFTEFYILGPNGKADDYPTNLKTGESGTVIVGVVNHEYQYMEYNFIAKYMGETVERRLIMLSDNNTHTFNLSFTAQGNETEKLEFLLYRADNASTPYRTLHLWVKSSTEPPKKNTTTTTTKTTTTTTTTTTTPNPARIIYSIGDSVTSGGGGLYGHRTSLEPKFSKGRNRNHTYQYWLDRLLGSNASAENGSISFYNKGISAQTCAQILSRYDYDIGKDGDVILQCGIKDLITGGSPEDVEESIEKIFDLAQDKNNRLIILSILPYDKGRYCPQVLEINSWLKNFSEKKKITYVDVHSILSNGTNCIVNESFYEADAINLNFAGHAELGRQIWLQAYEEKKFTK